MIFSFTFWWNFSSLKKKKSKQSTCLSTYFFHWCFDVYMMISSQKMQKLPSFQMKPPKNPKTNPKLVPFNVPQNWNSAHSYSSHFVFPMGFLSSRERVHGGWEDVYIWWLKGREAKKSLSKETCLVWTNTHHEPWRGCE